MKAAYRETLADTRYCAPAAQCDNEKNIVL
jgi:hypothetical protein